MADPEICTGCGNALGMGTLFDQYPEPPALRTSVHRLFIFYKNDFASFPTQAEQDTPIDKDDWVVFASTHKCIVRAEYLDNEGARYGFD